MTTVYMDHFRDKMNCKKNKKEKDPEKPSGNPTMVAYPPSFSKENSKPHLSSQS